MKKIIILMLVVILTITACQSPTQNSSSTQNTDIKIFMQGISNMSESDKAFVKQMEEKNNIKIKFEIPPSASYDERLQLMLVSGEYPDVILFNDSKDKKFIDSVKNGLIIPVNNYLKDAENLKKYTYDISWETLKINKDDNIYGIPRTSIIRADGYIIRKDWLDNLGINLPNDGVITLDEFTTILKRFTFDDPDMNGKKDTYGYSHSLNTNGALVPILLPTFGVYGWMKSNSSEFEYMDAMYDRKGNAYKDALQYSAYLYKEKLIDPDSTVNKVDVATERFKQGICGVMPGFAGWMYGTEQSMKKLNPKAQLTYITAIKKNKNDKLEIGAPGTGMFGMYTITKKANNPAKIVSIFNWLLSDEGWDTVKFGVEGFTYTLENNKKKMLPGYNEHNFGKLFMRRNNDPQFFTNLSMPEKEREKIEKYIDQCIKQAVPTVDLGYKPPAVNLTEFLDYQKTMTKTIAQIVVGDLKVDEYDKVLQGWYDAGGLDYITQMCDYVNKKQK